MKMRERSCSQLRPPDMGMGEDWRVLLLLMHEGVVVRVGVNEGTASVRVACTRDGWMTMIA